MLPRLKEAFKKTLNLLAIPKIHLLGALHGSLPLLLQQLPSLSSFMFFIHHIFMEHLPGIRARAANKIGKDFVLQVELPLSLH